MEFRDFFFLPYRLLWKYLRFFQSDRNLILSENLL